MIIAKGFCPSIKISWQKKYGAWRPFLSGFKSDEKAFSEALADALLKTSPEPFEIEKKLPFTAARFAKTLKESQSKATSQSRKTADLLAAFGSEVCIDKENFEDTLFRMVRSGDSAGQGLLFYALSIRNAVGVAEVHRTLFEFWDYKDRGFSLRWDPIEDQRYALRWHDPSKNRDENAPSTMNGANALALEALALFPAVSYVRKRRLDLAKAL